MSNNTERARQSAKSGLTPRTARTITLCFLIASVAVVALMAIWPNQSIPLLDTSKIESAWGGSGTWVYVGPDHVGCHLVSQVTVTSEMGVQATGVGLECNVPAKRWNELVSDVAAMAFGPSLAALLLFHRWLSRGAGRGERNLQARAWVTDVSLIIIGVALWFWFARVDITMMAVRQGEDWVIQYGDGSWWGRVSAQFSNVGLGLVFGSVITYFSTKLTSEVQHTLRRTAGGRPRP